MIAIVLLLVLFGVMPITTLLVALTLPEANRLIQIFNTSQEIPLLHLLSTSVENLQNRAERLATQMAGAGAVKDAQAVSDVTYLGGGSIPAQRTPTRCVSLAPREMTVDQFAKALRTGTPSVVGRVKEDRLLLDLRSVPPRQDRLLVSAVEALSPTKREGNGEASADPVI